VPPGVVVDCDPGLDDALALALLAAHPSVRLDLVTTVAGNAPLDVVTANAHAVVAALGIGLPVARGAAGRPGAPPRLSTGLWGGDGALNLPATSAPATPSAAAAFARTVASGRVTLLAIGPMTNVAEYLATHPGKVATITAMGGALGRGNATPEAELNVWADPGSAAAVFASGVPIAVAPLDLTRELHPPAGFAARLDAGRPVAALAARLFGRLGAPHEPATPHDLAAAGWLLWPGLFETRRGRIEVVTQAGPREGRTVFTPDVAGAHTVLTAVDADGFWSAVAATLNAA
jgi:pyrimidine-specific ribonucleoside hydrolase